MVEQVRDEAEEILRGMAKYLEGYSNGRCSLPRLSSELCAAIDVLSGLNNLHVDKLRQEWVTIDVANAEALEENKLEPRSEDIEYVNQAIANLREFIAKALEHYPNDSS